MPNCSISLQVLPDVPKERLFSVVDQVIAYIASTGVKYVVGPFDTTMEGEFDQLMDILKRSQEIVLESGADSVFSNVKIAYCREGVYTIEEKVTKHQH